VTIFDLHAQYRGRGLDLRALYTAGSVEDAHLVNDASSLTGTKSVGERIHGWYAQAGWDLLSTRKGAQSLTPFARFERLDTQARVPGEAPRTGAAFARNPANNLSIWTFGAAYKPIDNVSLKAEWQNFENQAGTAVDQFSLVLGWLF
jgi:hypothetical protein